MGIPRHFGRENYVWGLDTVQSICEFYQIFLEFLGSELANTPKSYTTITWIKLKIGEFVKDILKEKHKQKEVDQKATFKGLQSKNANVMGPLSRFWLLIEKALASEEEQVPTELDKAFFF